MSATNTLTPPLYGYICFYKGKRHEVYAPTSYAAQCQLAKTLHLSAKQQCGISVTLAERPDGSSVTHTAVD